MTGKEREEQTVAIVELIIQLQIGIEEVERIVAVVGHLKEEVGIRAADIEQQS